MSENNTRRLYDSILSWLYLPPQSAPYPYLYKVLRDTYSLHIRNILIRDRQGSDVPAQTLLRPSPFFSFIVKFMRFLILGRSVGKEKKKKQKKIGKGVWN